MSLPMVRLPTWSLLVLACALLSALPGNGDARTATARIERVSTPVATLRKVRVRLEWEDGASQGELRIQAGTLDAPDLGYRFRDLDWQCPLTRAADRWQCKGVLRSGASAPFGFSLTLDDAKTNAVLTRGAARIGLDREAQSPDITRIDLARVPVAWTQALVAQAWADARLTGGTLDASLAIRAPAGGRLQIEGPVKLQAAGVDTPDGAIAAENLGARLHVDARFGEVDEVNLDGQLLGGELLFGRTYVSLGERRVPLHMRAVQRDAGGWQLPAFSWDDPGVLKAAGSATLGSEQDVEVLDLTVDSPSLQALGEHYLSGWLGAAGLGELQLRGAASAQLGTNGNGLQRATLSLEHAGADDPRGRFRFDDLHGDLQFSAGAPVASDLRWAGGALYGIEFGAARLPWRSADGVLQLREDLVIPLLDGTARFEGLQLRPASGESRFDVKFGLALDGLDVRQLAKVMGWPEFGGELSGRIPQAHYREDRLTLDGGLAMQLFDGRIDVSSLSMERPFGTAPTLTADLALDDLDLQALTGVFGFGSITGRLDGRVAGLRLVDWQPVAFDARLQTDPKRGVRQRISQRAVQDLSSVGDASLMSSLQSQVIGLFDDFGYSRIAIGCRLVDEVCTMDGLGSADRGFIIVQGAGLPRLTVVGFNRRVDWPLLVERLAAAGSGDVRPVVD
ncbi:hypothetical protein ACFFGH_07010 [Lysobacter korlensis]|uniref:Dicarboxylate transport domain-containing protein n=1 Tax=Lysobacter korlensis TaxID=553636 RepID=A0ABV6RMK0_9GAMM